MKFNRFDAQPDPHVSMLDIIFCLCVVFCFALVVFIQAKHEVEKNKESTVNHNRFCGGGGQSTLPVLLKFDKTLGLLVDIDGVELSYVEFRKMLANFDRKEEDDQPSLLISADLDQSYIDADIDDIFNVLNKDVDKDSIQKEKENGGGWYLVNLYKKKHVELEKSCVQFKKKYTTDVLGNWDSMQIKSKEKTGFSERKKKGSPFVWFTVRGDKIVMGPVGDPVELTAEEFSSVIGSIKGGDGFYIEYRDFKTLHYNVEADMPSWVLDKVFDPMGFIQYKG